MSRAMLLAAAFGSAGFPAPAQEAGLPRLPALHSVTDVAPGDVLNVRSAPDETAEKIGELAPDAILVEVTAVDVATGWMRLNVAERAGWVSGAFLTPMAGGALPDVTCLACFGTEPFWSLEVDAGGLSSFSEPEDEMLFLASPVRMGEARPDRFAVIGGAPGTDLALSMSAEECSDGMSDRLFGLSATLLVSGAATRTLSGCCSLRAPAQ